MEITNFEQTGMEKVVRWIKNNEITNLEEELLREALKTVNLSFAVEGINRMQSTLLCELKDSYVQQSQRYVSMAEDAYQLPDLSAEDNKQVQQLINQAFQLYEEMSELKEGEFKGRPKLEHYKHGIPIEDARYILPLATKTNVSVAMTGNKLYDLFSLLYKEKYDLLFEEMRSKLSALLPDSVVQLLPNELATKENAAVIEDLYEDDFKKLNSQQNMILLDSFNNLDLRVGLGAATSTAPQPPSKKLQAWGDKAEEKARGLAKRVLGYGHESIAEQARTTFAMMCSMVTYHQQIRHRLSENHRERLLNVTLNERPVLVPPTIEGSKFEEKFLALADKIKKFRLYIYKEYGLDKALPFILNCDQIKLIISTNARIDKEMLAERICMNAQWEIRQLSTKKLLQLRESSDVLYEKALPPCVHGQCTEGKLSCGQQEEVREKFLG